MSDGSITFSTALDNAQLEKDLKDADRKVKSLENKLEKSSSSKNFIEKQMEDAEVSIRETETEIERLKAKLADLNSYSSSPQEFMSRQPLVEQTTAQLDEANESLKKQIKNIDSLNDKWQKADQQSKAYAEDLESAKGYQRDISNELTRSYAAADTAKGKLRFSETMEKNKQDVSGALESTGAMFSNFGNRIKTMMKKVFLFGVILAGLRALKAYLADAMGENKRLAQSFEGMKATIAGFAAGLINAFAPAITGFIAIVTSMFTTLARIVDAIFHTNIVAAIESAKKAAGAVNKQSKATKNLAKAQKEANAQLMSFDEINKMDDKDDPSSNTSGSGSGSDFPGLAIGAIDDTLAAIMGILGAALLAVGAILCFSGINIPLGIGLMAIGALMIYSVAQENWKKLPDEVKAAITGMLVITGLVLIAIGAVLAFSGAATPIGIGMIAAGAAMIWAAVALNWNSMPQEVKSIVSALMAILGGALLVIGIILALSGGGTPLGIGIMAIGAASLVAAVALNWDALPEEVQAALGVIFGVVSVAFLVLGAILSLSGAALPLGVGLMIVGAGLLISAVALNWSKMPDEVKSIVNTLLTVVGGALIVIGIILLCTGAGIPLGIACILAGIGSFVAAAALNWDFLINSIKNLWSRICSWWDSTVAPIFTVNWWRNKFKSIINGLIYNVNQGLNAFGRFVNGIADGVSGVLSNFGVSWSGHVTMPQIPYLAQGAVIPPNKKFMAVLGDQTSGNNLEAPESLIRKIVREESGGGIDPAVISAAVQQGVALALASSSASDTEITLVLQVGNEELARATNKGNQRLVQRGAIKTELQFV